MEELMNTGMVVVGIKKMERTKLIRDNEWNKSKLEGIKSKLDDTEEWKKKLENSSEITQTAQKKKKKSFFKMRLV